MPPQLFQHVLQLDATGYTVALETVVKRWEDLVFDGSQYVVSARAHKDVVTQD